MTLWQKYLKFFGFSYLALACVAAFWLGTASEASAAKEVLSQKKCVSDFTSQLGKIKNKAKKLAWDLNKLDPESACGSSKGTENDKVPANAKRPSLQLGKKKEAQTTQSEGACQSSYEAVKLVFDRLADSRKETCENTLTGLEDKFPECLQEKPADNCKDKVDQMAKAYKDGKKQLQDDIKNARQFLNDFPKWNKDAGKKFSDDLTRLKNMRGSSPEKLAWVGTPDNDPHPVWATNQGAATLNDYLAKLEIRRPAVSTVSGATPLSPIDEQADAAELVKEFRHQLKEFSEQEDKDLSAKITSFREALERATNNKSLITDNFTKYGGLAPAAAPFLKNNSGGSAITTGGSGALPALAALGVAGAAGAAFGAKSVGSGKSSLPTPSSPEIQAVAGATNLTDNGDGSAASPTSPAPVAGNEPGEESENPDSPAPAAGGQAGYGGGASSMPTAKVGAPANRETASTSTLPVGDEALKSFSGDLRPSPRPSASTDNSGNDVSNLLGKMKDLFNLDENFGMDAPPPGGFAGPGGVVSPTGDGTPYVGGEDGEYAEDSAEEAYADGGEESSLGAGPWGSPDTPLFRRVHLRHEKCMERGLVLLRAEDLPQ